MRRLSIALLIGVLGACAKTSADALPLADCRVDHPLGLASLAARCGRLVVPEDPAEPQGSRIALAVAVVPALNRSAPAEPLFVLAGGPGQAASDLYAGYAAAFARINRNHDIVLLDQRGTGRSGALVCAYPDDWLGDFQGAENALRDVRRATETCLEHLGRRVRFYTTSPAVDDLEAVRIALHYPQVDLYGSSYGTRVAQLYARRYPEHLHALILDGVTDPQRPIGPDTPADAERALKLIVERCARAAPCHAAFPDLAGDLAALRQRFGPQAVALTLDDPSTGEPLPLTFNRSMLNAALRFLSYSAAEASLLPTLLHRAAGGHLEPLAAQTVMMARQVGAELASGMQNSVICSEDVPRFVISAEDRRRLNATYQGTDQLDALNEVCRIWPKGPVDAQSFTALSSDVPALLLSGEADPVTPPDSAVRAARGFKRGLNLVLPGEGHGQLATGCVPRLMAAFLDDPSPERINTRCLSLHRPAAFFLGATGPEP